VDGLTIVAIMSVVPLAVGALIIALASVVEPRAPEPVEVWLRDSDG
jgi:hypothetical protein